MNTLRADRQHAVRHHDSPDDRPVPFADLSEYIPPPPLPNPPQELPESARTDILTTPLVDGSTFKSFSRQEWCKLKVLNGSYAPDEPVLHIEHPPHILRPLGENDAGDDESEAETVFTDLVGGVVTEERLLDESLGRPKRRLIPVVDVRVGKRSKVGGAEDIVHDEVQSGGEADDGPIPAQDFSDHTEHHDLPDIPAEDTPESVPTQDPANHTEHHDLQDMPAEDMPGSVPVEATPLDLGESAALEDPIDTETTYSPLVGPRPDDILFDLSDDDDEGDGVGIGDASGDASESEVWAELEDQEMTQAFTPAGMLGDYDVSDDEDGALDEDEGGDQGEEEGEGMEAIRAAILSDPLDDQAKDLESEEAALNSGDVIMLEDVDDETGGEVAALDDLDAIPVNGEVAETSDTIQSGHVVEESTTIAETTLMKVQTSTMEATGEDDQSIPDHAPESTVGDATAAIIESSSSVVITTEEDQTLATNVAQEDAPLATGEPDSEKPVETTPSQVKGDSSAATVHVEVLAGGPQDAPPAL